RLRIAQTDRPDAPRPVARADEAVHGFAHAIELDPAMVASVLRQARIIHQCARADTADEPWLLDRRTAPAEDDIGDDAAIRRIDRHAQFAQRLDHLDADRAGADIHPLHIEAARGVQRGLDAVADHDKGGVRDVEMWIDA